MKWQPIDSAPENQNVIIYFQRYGHDCVTVGRLDTSANNIAPRWTADGFSCSAPTHWMPLPSPPAETNE